MAAYAALVSLMQVIRDVQHHPSPPISLDKQLVDSITQHITFFQDFLQAYCPPLVSSNDEESADPLEMRIAKAAYTAEDAIESHIVDIISIQQLRRRGAGSIITRVLDYFRGPTKEPTCANDEKIKSINLCRVRLESAIGEMDLIKKEVVEKVDSGTKKKALVVHDHVATTSVLASVAREETMVGSNDVLLEIMEKLVRGESNRQVIPIVGMGGIGKTLLAKTVYTTPHIKDHFDICAWATISQRYNAREILCEILSQATNINKEYLSGKSEHELASELHEYLFGRRFLIVLDDMWSFDAWNKIQRFFPDGNGSRVLVTTRLSQLSSQLNKDYNFRMSFLDEASSWDLFSKTVFGDNSSCPHELEKIGEKIVDHCRGLPLSIVVVGGLLKKMGDNRASWESVRDNLSSVVNMANDKHCLKLLKLSYNHLPAYLKPCFLYMGVFKEDEVICVSPLIRLWISEGFLIPTNGEALEITARGFLQDLIDRNLLLIHNMGSIGSIKSFKIHDLLRDLCLLEGQKDGFYHVIKKCNPPPHGMHTQRRVVIPINTSKKRVRDELRSMVHARSVICEYGKFPPYRDLGLLRTLHAYKPYHFSNKTHVKSLAYRYVNLQHLAIDARGMSSFIPSISLLWNLHTLIVSCSEKLTLLTDFWKMPQFRHIEFVNECLCLPDPPSDGRYGDDVVIMENLHTLKGVRNFKCCEGVVKRIPNIKKLKIRYDHDLLGTNNTDDAENFVGLIKSLHGLESLSITFLSELFGTASHMPIIKKLKIRYDHDLLGTNNTDDAENFVGLIKSLHGLESLSITFLSELFGTASHMHRLTFPHSVKKLNLCMEFGFEWEDTMEKIGSLPYLEKLNIYGGHFGKGMWETVEGQFPCLKFLKLESCLLLKNWEAAEEGSNILPRLEHLRLISLVDLKKIPCEVGYIDTLKSIVLFNCREEAVKSAKEMVDEQVELQGDQLPFHVVADLRLSLGEHEHLLSLAGPNFKVVI